MLLEEKTKRISLLVVLALATACTFVLLRLGEKKVCLGISLISEHQASQYTLCPDLDLTELRYNGEKAPLDLDTYTLYLSQGEESLGSYTDLQGILTTESSRQSIYLVEDSALKDPQAAIGSGTPLTLLVVEGDQCCPVNVVLTTLPVFTLEGQETDVPAKYGYEMEGDCTLFAGYDPASGGSSVESSRLEWHIRGETTAKYDKKSYKLSLKDKDGDNNHCDLLGMGADDDWILNPMVMDDTKLREKTVMDLWNSFAEVCDWNYKMSCGEYVEVILNGEYRGLYLLQRRVDAKYLDIDKEQDLLLKGNDTDPQYKGYEIISSPFSNEETYALMEDTWQGLEGNRFHRENFIDVTLLINYIAGLDNVELKNMFYYLKYDEERQGYDLYFIPWDTDMSFGLYWEDGFTYNYQKSLTTTAYRIEYYTQQLYSQEMDRQLAQHWQELRSSLFSEDNILAVLDYNQNRILSSGAYQRDQEKWGLFHQGADTQENLHSFCAERLSWLDTYYS